jgi:hypothetical protein
MTCTGNLRVLRYIVVTLISRNFLLDLENGGESASLDAAVSKSAYSQDGDLGGTRNRGVEQYSAFERVEILAAEGI